MSYVLVYFILGIVSLAILEALTHRITAKFSKSAYDTQDIMANAGMPASTKTAKIVLGIALFIFWPFAIAPAIAGYLRRKRV